MRVRAYFDGFNFYHGSSAIAKQYEADHGEALLWKWLDVRRLCANIAEPYWEPVEVTYVAYCTAKVKPLFPRDEKPKRQQRYLDALAAKDVEIVEGTFKSPRKWREMADSPGRNPRSATAMEARVILPGEKGSDVNLATRLLLDYYTRRDTYDASLVISNDYDLWQPVEALRGDGWPVGIASPHGERNEIVLENRRWGHPCFGYLMTADDLIGAPMEDPVVGLDGDGNPGTWHSPEVWTQRETPPQ